MNIHKFAGLGDVQAVRNELANGIPIDARDDRDFTPLAHAAKQSAAEPSMLSLLINSGADVNAAVDGSKDYPIGLAACSGCLEKVQHLAGAGANVTFVAESGYTALINIMYKLLDDRCVARQAA